MTPILASLAVILPFFFLYSPRVEQVRVVTVSKPLVITQERKTPAYYLYQQIQITENTMNKPAAMTTYLSSQNYIPPKENLAVNEMKVDRREIASAVDAGFTLTKPILLPPTPTVRANVNPVVLANFESRQPAPTNLSPATKWATVRGKFEMRGVGVINDQVIELKRIEEGQVRELGRIDLKAGLYTIDIESPTGVLVAEIKDKNGILIGIDRQKMINLQSRGPYLEGPFMQVRNPDTIAANPVASNGRSATVATLFSDQNILEKPNDEFGNISRYSSTLATITDAKQKNRKILTIRQTGDQNQTPLFTEGWIQGILDYISDQQKIEFKSKSGPLIIGRILVDDKPAASVQVQIENHPGLAPIYLDQFMIPNASQTQTSENGYFMFVGLESENYSVTAFKQNQIIGHQIFIAEEGAVSFQNILSSSTVSSVIVRSFDAFSSEPVDIDLISPDFEEILQTVSGNTRFRHFGGARVDQYLVRTNHPDYLPIRYVQDSRKDYVHVPMIQESWLRQIQAKHQINEFPDTAVIVGFVPEFDFDVYVASEQSQNTQVIYFDLQGQTIETPVQGGGFILFNVPTNVREVVVQEKNTDRIYSQVFDLKSSQVSVAHFTD